MILVQTEEKPDAKAQVKIYLLRSVCEKVEDQEVISRDDLSYTLGRGRVATSPSSREAGVDECHP